MNFPAILLVPVTHTKLIWMFVIL